MACLKTKNFFESGSSNQFEWVLALYDEVLRLKAEAKSQKPENVIKLDKWYQNDLPKKIKSRGKDLHLTHDEMVQTIKWKLARGKFRPNLVNLVQMNTPRVVMTDTKKAFRKLSKTNDVQAAASILCNMKGVSPGMASAVLAAGAPQMAPFMADECLLSMPDVDSIEYTMKEYMSLVENINKCVERLNQQGGSWNPHRVELAIWTHYVAHDLKPELLADIPSASAAAAPPKPAVPAATTADDETTADTPSETPSPATQTDEDSNGAGEDATNSRPNTADPDAKAASENTTATDSESAEKAIPSESHHQTETSPCPAAVNGGQNGHGQAEETQVATPSVPVPVNGTNGNGKHHTSDDEEAETAAAKSISNGSSEKQENGTTKLSESDKAPVVTDSTKTVITPPAVDEQQTVEPASVDSSIKSSQCKRPSTDLSTTPPPKKIRTEDSPPPSEQQPEVKKSIVPEQPEGATVA